MTIRKQHTRTRRGPEFESAIKSSFPAYQSLGIARLKWVPVPTVPAPRTGIKGPPLRIFSGKADFDVYGWRLCDGKFVGAEVKASREKVSLSIIKQHGKGEGLQYHQLKALAELVMAGGEARLVWKNGDEVGVIGNIRIGEIWTNYRRAIALNLAGKNAPAGSKSIKWGMFEVVGYVTADKGKHFLHWLKIGGVCVRDSRNFFVERKG